MAFALRSERSGGFAILTAVASNIDGDQAQVHGLPAGFGDCWLLHLSVVVTGIATVVATPFDLGVRAFIGADSGNSAQDVIGTARWVQDQATALTLRITPRYPMWWRAEEQIVVAFQEVDTNATPTADLTLFAGVQRVRNQPEAVGLPVRFVS